MEADQVEELLHQDDIHREWDRLYRNEETDPFYRAAIGALVDEGDLPSGSLVLDAGAGSCAHSLRLAEKGLDVCSVDLAEAPLATARSALPGEPGVAKIRLTRGDVTKLPFQSGSFDHVFCWGVLMHVPDLSAAVAELVRVAKPGGHVVISEVNARSLESSAQRVARKLFRKDGAIQTSVGFELRVPRPDGVLFIRHIRAAPFEELFALNGCSLVRRRAGQLFEIYGRIGSARLRRLVHRLNLWWFRRVGYPGVAVGNLFVFRKS